MKRHGCPLINTRSNLPRLAADGGAVDHVAVAAEAMLSRPTRAMTCPKCRLANPPSAGRCDCGYDFDTGVIAESYLSSKQRVLNQPHGSIDVPASARAFTVAGMFAATFIGLARVSGPTGVIGAATYVLGLLAIATVAVGGVLLAWKKTRACAGLLVAVGLGAGVGLYVTLWAVL